SKAPGQPDQAARAGAVEDRLRQLTELADRKIADKPIAGDAAFGEDDHADILARCLFQKPLDFAKVSLLIARRAFKLDRGNAQRAVIYFGSRCAHGRRLIAWERKDQLGVALKKPGRAATESSSSSSSSSGSKKGSVEDEERG